MRTKITIALIVAVIISIFSGCWDMTDVNDHIFILGIGIDKDKDSLLKFTFHYADPLGSDSDQSSDKITYINTAIRASSLPLAVREFVRNSDAEANFEHLQTVVFGSDYLSEMSLYDIDMLFRMASVRRKCIAVTSDTTAYELLSAQLSSISTATMISRLSNHYTSSKSSTQEGYSLTSIYAKASDNLSFSLLSVGVSDNKNFSSISETDQTESSNLSLIVSGLSVFKSSRYSGCLGYPELEIIRILYDEQNNGNINIFREDGTSACYQIMSSRCTRKCNIENNKPVFRLDIDANCLLIESENSDYQHDKILIENIIRKKIEHIFILSKTQYGPEILGFETAVRQQHNTWFENNRNKWQDLYSDSEMEINIECRISSSGIIE